MAHMNELYECLQESLFYLDAKRDDKPTCDVYIPANEEGLKNLIKKIQMLLHEHNALKIGHLART